jgi:hypothetical protein
MVFDWPPYMSALNWMRRRALEREAGKLRDRIEARRLAATSQTVTTAGSWFTGAGLSLASGFMTGVSVSIPPNVDREAFLRLLMRAAAAAVIAAAAFVDAHPPDSVPPGQSGPPAAEPSAALGPSSAVASTVQVTRADLLERLRQQRAAAERTG